MTNRFNSLAVVATVVTLAITSAPVLAANVQAAPQPSMSASAAKAKPKLSKSRAAQPAASAPSGVGAPNPYPGGQGTAPKKPTRVLPGTLNPPAGTASAAQ